MLSGMGLKRLASKIDLIRFQLADQLSQHIRFGSLSFFAVGFEGFHF